MRSIFYKSIQLQRLFRYIIAEVHPDDYISDDDVLYQLNQFILEYLSPEMPILSENPVSGFYNYPALEVFEYTHQKQHAVGIADNIMLEIETLGIPLQSISDCTFISADGIMCIKYKDELCQQLY